MANILVVEDHPDVASLFCVWVRLMGHAVQTCRTGLEALQLVLESRHSVVLLDLGLPGMDGWELAKEIRRKGQINQPMLIAISAYRNDEDFDRSALCGIDFHLPKPIEYRTFREVLARVFGSGKQSLA